MVKANQLAAFIFLFSGFILTNQCISEMIVFLVSFFLLRPAELKKLNRKDLDLFQSSKEDFLLECKLFSFMYILQAVYQTRAALLPS